MNLDGKKGRLSQAILGMLSSLLVFGLAKLLFGEAFTPQWAYGWLVVGLFGTLLALGGAALVWWSQNHRNERQPDLTAAALRDNETRFHLLFEQHSAIMLLIDPLTGMIIDANQAAVQFYGYPKATLCSLQISQITMLSPEQEALEQQKALQEARSASILPHKLADGTERLVEVYASPLLMQARQVLFAIIHDVSARKHTEALVYAQRDLARIISTVSTSQAAWPLCLELALQVTGMDSGGIYLLDAEERILELVHYQGLSPAFVQATSPFPADTPNARAMLANKMLYVNAAQIQPIPYLRNEGLTAAASIAIHYQGRNIGALNVGSRTLTEVPTFARHALETIATEIANLAMYLRTEEALRRNTQILSEAQAIANLASWTADLQTKTFQATSTGSHQLAWLAETTHTTQSLLALTHPDDQAYVQASWVAAMQSTTYNVEHRIILQGEVRWVFVKANITLTAQGQPLKALGIVQDITERKEAEAELHESRLRVELALNGANMGMWDYYVQTGKTVFNERWAEMLGYTLAELEPISIQTWADLCHPADLAHSDALLAQHYARETAFYECEARMRHKNGSWIWVVDRGKVVEWDANGQPIRMTGTHLDITERKQAELALRVSEEKYRGLMESLASAIHTIDASGRFLYINEVAARQLALPPHAIIGKTLHDLFPVEVATRQLAQLTQVIRADRELITEWRGALQGEPRWYRTSIQPLHDETGQVSAVLVNSTDINDLKLAQQALLELNQTLEERVAQRTAEVQDLYEHAPTGYYSLDANGRLIMINQTLLNWFGYTREEMLGRPYADFLTSASRQHFPARYSLLKERGWLRDITYECIRKDGTIFPALLHATAIYDEHGTFVMSRSTIFDNTERKKAEEALRESEAQNRLLFEESPDAVVLFDATINIVQMNRAFETLTGYTSADLVGRRLDTLGLVAPEYIAQLNTSVTQHMQATNRFATAEFRLTDAYGEQRDVGMRVFGLTIRGHQHYLTTMRDITTEKKAAETLRRANTELARAARTKDEFLANMSHELRTPLNAVLSLSESLQEEIFGPVNRRQQVALHDIEESGRHLLALINDILDLSKVEAGRLDLQVESVLVVEICQASLSFVREMALKKDLKLTFVLDNETAEMEADLKRLKQMLVNLLSNAVKFTPDKGSVALNVTTDIEAGLIYFAVQDTGIGIAAEDLPQLFQPFRQLDSSLSRQYEGSGLGLALVQRLADLHGGSVMVESTLGQGSCFTVMLPYCPPQAVARPERMDTPAPVPTPPPLVPAPALPKLRILLADDSEVNLQTISTYLEYKGYAVAVARTGYEALTQAGMLRPDVILMDIQMPEMDGLEAIQELRIRADSATTPIIALTALAMTGDRERCLAAGATEYLAKPVSLKELVALIQRVAL